MKTNPAFFAGMVTKSRPVVDRKLSAEITTRRTKPKYGLIKADPHYRKAYGIEQKSGE